MDELTYSRDALNVINDFHEVDIMVYVEGKDDVPFWEFMIENLAEPNFKVKVQEPCGGIKEAKKYANDVRSGVLNAIVALDSDFSNIHGIPDQHPLIIRTYGYSIENSIITAFSICESLKNFPQVSSQIISTHICQKWLDDLALSARQFIIYSVAHSFESDDSSQKFLKTCYCFINETQKYSLCETKILDYLSSLNIPESYINHAQSKIDNLGVSYFNLINGHFLFSFVAICMRSFLKEQSIKTNLDNNQVFANLLGAFKREFSNGNHAHFEFYKRQVGEASIYLQQINFS